MKLRRPQPSTKLGTRSKEFANFTRRGVPGRNALGSRRRMQDGWLSLVMFFPVLSSAASGQSGAPPALQFVAITPCRIMDTRLAARSLGGPSLVGGTTRDLPLLNSNCGLPAGVAAYSLNATVVPQGSLSYLTLWPTGQTQPLVSTLNSDGRIKANAAIVPAGANGSISVYATGNTDLVLDISGYFVPATSLASSVTGLQFFPVTPCRLLDTRDASGPFGGPRMEGDSTRALSILSSNCGVPQEARAYSLNITAVPTGPLQWLTAWPADQNRPFVSTLNSTTGTVVANAAIVPAGSSGDISLYVTNPADVIVDISGYFAPPANSGLSYFTLSPCRLSDTRLGHGPLGGPPLNADEQRTMSFSSSNCSVPTSARGYSLNATVIPRSTLTFLSLWPSGHLRPTVSTLNSFDGAIVANAAIVPAGLDGTIEAFVSDFSDLVLDVNGYFSLADASQAARIDSVTPVSGPPGAPVTFSGASFVAFTTSNGSGRMHILFDIGDGLKIDAPILSATTTSVTALVPPLIKNGKDWFQGSAQVCVEVDGQSNCAESTFDVMALQSTNSPPGQVLVSNLQNMLAQSVSLVQSSNPQLAAALQSSANSQIADVQAMVQDALQGKPRTVSFTDFQGQQQTAIADLQAISVIESLLVASQSSQSSIKSIAHLSNTAASSCSTSDEAMMAATKEQYEMLEKASTVFNYSVYGAMLAGATSACLAAGGPLDPPGCLLAAGAVTAKFGAIGIYLKLGAAPILASQFYIEGSNSFLSSIDTPVNVQTGLGKPQVFDISATFTTNVRGTITDYVMEKLVEKTLGFTLPPLLAESIEPIFMPLTEQVSKLIPDFVSPFSGQKIVTLSSDSLTLGGTDSHASVTLRCGSTPGQVVGQQITTAGPVTTPYDLVSSRFLVLNKERLDIRGSLNISVTGMSDVSGTWTGTWTLISSGLKLPATMTFSEGANQAVTASATIGPYPNGYVALAQLAGSRAGSQIVMLPSDNPGVTYTFNVSDDSMSGSSAYNDNGAYPGMQIYQFNLARK